jgi:glycosyltransferase involved in cell wall biosynthesis
VELLVPRFADGIEAGVLDAYEFYGIVNTFKILRVPFSTNRLMRFAFARKVAMRARMTRADLVYGRSLHASFFSALAGVRSGFEAHALQDGWVSQCLLRLASHLHCFGGVVTITAALKELFAKAHHFPRSKIYVEHDAADEQPDFDPLRNWPGRSNALQVGYAGHLYEGKGAEVVCALAERMPEVDFHCVGGTQEDIARLTPRHHRNNLFFHGFVKPGEVYKYRNACDILLAPYQEKVGVWGGGADIGKVMSPLKIFEYMSSRKAIVCSNLPVLREILNPSNALLVACDRVEAWVEATGRLQRDERLRQMLAQQAYDDFVTRHTWKRRAERILATMTAVSPAGLVKTA